MSRSRRRRGLTRRRLLGLAAGGLAAVGATHAFWYEPRALEITRRRIPLRGRNRPPVRLVQISDLHLSEFNDYFTAVAARVSTLAPDLVVLTGDYLEEERNIRGVLEFLKQLRARHGIFAVQGNWEYWSRLEGENLRRHFAGAGVRLLINEAHEVEIGSHPLTILGLDYPSSTDHLLQLQQQHDPERTNLLLSHVPAFAHEQLGAGIDLILSGHTHGGQVRLPAIPPFYLPRYSGRFVAGLYHVSQHRIPLYVSRGIGTSLLPVRFLCRPEMTLFEIG